MNKSDHSLARRRQRDTNRVAAVFLAPVLLLLVVYIFYPIIETFRVSAFSWNGISANQEFIGLDNWVKLCQDQKFWTAFFNNIKVMILSAQIKPHFLYNTLECIHWQAVADGNQEISIMVKAMAQYYRVCLSRGKEIIPLSQELEHIYSYLVIQNMRYDNIIDLENHIPECFHNVNIPKMTLQPLVENAIYHGIRIKEGGKGKIVLGIRRNGTDVYLSLGDSGFGMSQKQIDEINQSISQYDESFGYGVRNVNRRIELMFGTTYGLHYSRNEHGGVTVEIHLPFDVQSEDKEVI